MKGAYRFLNRVWRLVVDNLKEILEAPVYDPGGDLDPELKTLHRKTHETIKRVTRDIEDRFHFNTAIAAVMELVNDVNRLLSCRETERHGAVVCGQGGGGDDHHASFSGCAPHRR